MLTAPVCDVRLSGLAMPPGIKGLGFPYTHTHLFSREERNSKGIGTAGPRVEVERSQEHPFLFPGPRVRLGKPIQQLQLTEEAAASGARKWLVTFIALFLLSTRRGEMNHTPPPAHSLGRWRPAAIGLKSQQT